MTVHSSPGTARRDDDAAGRPGTITGYAVMLPAGWRRIPVMHGTGKAIADFLDEAFSRLPPDRSRASIPYRLELERHLTETARQARREGVMDLYLPAGYVHGVAIPASIVVSRGTLGTSGFLDGTEIVAQLTAGSPGASPVTVDYVAGARLERSSGPEPARGVPCGSRRVEYVLPVPGDTGDWLIIAFSVLDAGGPGGRSAQALIEVFDAIMSTFRWRRD